MNPGMVDDLFTLGVAVVVIDDDDDDAVLEWPIGFDFDLRLSVIVDIVFFNPAVAVAVTVAVESLLHNGSSSPSDIEEDDDDDDGGDLLLLLLFDRDGRNRPLHDLPFLGRCK